VGRRLALVWGAVSALAFLAALAITWPDAGEGFWIDYAVPGVAVLLAIGVAVAGDVARTQLVARLVVGGVWLYAGWLKIGDPAASVAAVRAYELLPGSLVSTVGYVLPPLEIVLGVALILGLLSRGAALLSGLLATAFIIGIASAWARGLQIDCGCFGDGGAKADADLAYPWELARDVALVMLSAFLVRVRHRWLSLDRLLFRPSVFAFDGGEDPGTPPITTTEPDDEEEGAR